jgi:hypothetical protein
LWGAVREGFSKEVRIEFRKWSPAKKEGHQGEEPALRKTRGITSQGLGEEGPQLGEMGGPRENNGLTHGEVGQEPWERRRSAGENVTVGPGIYFASRIQARVPAQRKQETTDR